MSYWCSQGTLSSEDSSLPLQQQQQQQQPPPVTTFGSFLNRNTPTKKDKATPSAENAASSSASPLRTFRKPGNSSNSASKPKPKVSLEDQNSQDFVPITNSGRKKKRVLTEHQKDKMTSRPQNIPALYSEVSREDSMAMMAIPAEFDSQSSSSFQVRSYTPRERERG